MVLTLGLNTDQVAVSKEFYKTGIREMKLIFTNTYCFESLA